MAEERKVGFMAYGSIIVLTDWRKGDVLTIPCQCGRTIIYLLNIENKDSELHNRFIKCDECGQEYQLIF